MLVVLILILNNVSKTDPPWLLFFRYNILVSSAELKCSFLSHLLGWNKLYKRK